MWLSRKHFLLSFCKLSYDLENLLGVWAVAKIERTVFVCGRTCKSSPYELLPVQRVLFLLAVTSTSKMRILVSFVIDQEILENCFKVWSYTYECSLREQRFVFTRCDADKVFFVVFLYVVVQSRIFVRCVGDRGNLKTSFFVWSYK